MYTLTHITIHTNNFITKKKKKLHTISVKHTSIHILFLESEIHRN